MTAIVQLTNVQKLYRLGRVDVRGLRDVSLEIDRGGFIALAGPSGSGKTTLLNIIGCVDKPSAGRIVLDGVDVTQVPLHKLASTRGEMLGYVFQTFNLIPVLTAYENVEYPLLLRGVSRKERAAAVKHWLHAVGLDGHGAHRPDQLSGGQRQRVAIARAMAGEPELILADEPTANLDSVVGTQVLEMFRALAKQENRALVIVTHDPKVRAVADRVVKIHDGRLSS